jgi:hypothetical protein
MPRLALLPFLRPLKADEPSDAGDLDPIKGPTTLEEVMRVEDWGGDSPGHRAEGCRSMRSLSGWESFAEHGGGVPIVPIGSPMGASTIMRRRREGPWEATVRNGPPGAGIDWD